MTIALLTVLEWILRAAFMTLKLALWTVKLFLLLAVLAVNGVLSADGVTSGRR